MGGGADLHAAQRGGPHHPDPRGEPGPQPLDRASPSTACFASPASLYRRSLLDIARCLRLEPHGTGPKIVWPVEAAFGPAGACVTDIAGLEKLNKHKEKNHDKDHERVAM